MSRRLPVLAALVAALALLLPAVSSSVTAAGAPGAGSMSPGFTHDLATLAPTTQYGAFVTVQDGLDAAAVVAGHADGVQVLRNYPVISTAFVAGPIASIARLTSVPSVVHLHDNTKLEYFDDTSDWATRVGVVREPVAGGPYTAGASGPILNGNGVGVAIVDSGAFAAHPDLSDPVERNYKFVCTTPGLVLTATDTCAGNGIIDETNGDPVPTFGFVDVGDTNSDTVGGHGTHVTGILAGTGAASTGDYPAGTGPNTKGTFTGVAPGASVTMYGSGEAISVLFAVESLSHIYNYGNTFSPQIKVVSNSWGNPGGTAFDSSDPVNKLVDKLVDDHNVTVVFAASNDGGDGSSDKTSGYCKNPNPGVICVANYDDDTVSGGRDGALSDSSSRGNKNDTTTASWPDISAPGTWITSTCVVQPICTGVLPETRWAPLYNYISGTSMATPHVAGAVALMLQASPTMLPATVEERIQDNAYKYTFGAAYKNNDPQNPGTGDSTSWDKGAGLLNVQATLNAMGVSHNTSPTAPNCFEIFAGDGGDVGPLPGAADLKSMCVTQTATGFTYALTLTDASDFGPSPANTATRASYRLFQTIKGVEYSIDISATQAGVLPGVAVPVTAAATSASRSGNVVTFTVPFTALGNVAAGEPIYSVRMGAYFGATVAVVVDMAPGSDPGAVALNVHPMFGRPYARV